MYKVGCISLSLYIYIYIYIYRARASTLAACPGRPRCDQTAVAAWHAGASYQYYCCYYHYYCSSSSSSIIIFISIVNVIFGSIFSGVVIVINAIQYIVFIYIDTIIGVGGLGTRAVRGSVHVLLFFFSRRASLPSCGVCGLPLRGPFTVLPGGEYNKNNLAEQGSVLVWEFYHPISYCPVQT